MPRRFRPPTDRLRLAAWLGAALLCAAPVAARAGVLSRADLARRFPAPYVVGERDADLLRLVPDIRERDVYLCGPESFQDALIAGATRAGVPRSQLHHESFSF
jgi:ferredoxin-NADP reductase